MCGCVGKPNLVKCFGPRLRLWTLDFVLGPSFSIILFTRFLKNMHGLLGGLTRQVRPILAKLYPNVFTGLEAENPNLPPEERQGMRLFTTGIKCTRLKIRRPSLWILV